MTDLPAPLTPENCDLRDFPFMPLAVNRLRDSDLSKISTGNEFRCAILLYAASWHQTPAGSLPDDDVTLAGFAGFGFNVRAWKKVRQGALHGWIKCSDNRLYHPVVAEKVNSAWAGRVRYRIEKEKDRDRKSVIRLLEKTCEENLKMKTTDHLQLETSEGHFSADRIINVGNPSELIVIEKGDSGQKIVVTKEAVQENDRAPEIPKKALLLVSQENDRPSAQAIEMSETLRMMEVTVSARDETLQKWIAGGISIQLLSEAIALVRMRPEKKDGAIYPKYLDAVLSDLCNSNTKKNAAILITKTWWESATATEEKAIELGLKQIEGELWPYFRDRILLAAGPGPWSSKRNSGTIKQGCIAIGALLNERKFNR